MPLNQSLTFALYQIGAIQFGEFKLKSGQLSPIYINLRKIISYPDLLRTIGAAFWDNIGQWQFDLICGVPYTALPIATYLSLEHNIPMVMRRKEKKDYGTKQLIEGVFNPGQHCLIIEDIITTGSSILETANDLEQAGLKITDVIALIDREQGGIENLSKRFNPHTIISLTAILHSLLHSSLLNSTECKIVERLLEVKSQ
ncbi:MAG: orotate phosphoribosyltransferase [Gammaproteobacteria bacterium RIFCSPHIGHO2_12_FULL_37_14]|nr:MAG: orotate phosphoribosyltransferase [Gammaproteobacteria bacterium RIFCSPHIGHO2_12_FULL_37_14]